ncbi:hypothetical protein A3F65_03335 [Candidatus Saccharibacteria bacterium RIFCSPHIGHO2_12_FULL_47_16b]|nr:MAG: hypothetical protein A3F65_03335 [Candidatus Saccharibacteria bacterium RIFCSPHIGHO2_12_FULL_47_16b]
MKKDINISFKSLKAVPARLRPILNKHGVFAAVLFVSIVYLFVVWRISSYAGAEPAVEAVDEALTSSAVPKIDPKAIGQIQSLEQNSPQVQALFNQARNNPFQE